MEFEYGAMRNNTRNLKNTGHAKTLRKSMSYSEKVLWASLRNNQTGFRFRRQVPVGPYVLDFYCAEAFLCVEVDGEQHEFRKARDEKRDEYLKSKGIETIRLPSLVLFDGFTYIPALNDLIFVLERRTGRSRTSI